MIDQQKEKEGTMDFADLAQIYIETELEKNISKFKSNNVNESRPKTDGYCLNCYEDIEDGKLFCNSLCAEQFEFKRRMRRY